MPYVVSGVVKTILQLMMIGLHVTDFQRGGLCPMMQVQTMQN